MKSVKRVGLNILIFLAVIGFLTILGVTLTSLQVFMIGFLTPFMMAFLRGVKKGVEGSMNK